jgi:hypothetical protein
LARCDVLSLFRPTDRAQTVGYVVFIDAPASSCLKPMSRVTACRHPPIGGIFASVITFLHFATSAFT